MVTNVTSDLPDEVVRRLNVEPARLADFCRHHRIEKLEIFGSVLRDDFDPRRSDVDFLYTLDPAAVCTLFDEAGMEIELAGLVGRKVDFFSRRAVELSPNPYRRPAILNSARVLYEKR